MQKHISLASLAVVAMAACVSTSAMAQDGQRQVYQASTSAPTQTGLYLGVSVGQQPTKLETALETDSGLKYSVLGGFRFNRNLRLEGRISNTQPRSRSRTPSPARSMALMSALWAWWIWLTASPCTARSVWLQRNEVEQHACCRRGYIAPSTNPLLGTGLHFRHQQSGVSCAWRLTASCGDNKIVSWPPKPCRWRATVFVLIEPVHQARIGNDAGFYWARTYFATRFCTSLVIQTMAQGRDILVNPLCACAKYHQEVGALAANAMARKDKTSHDGP